MINLLPPALRPLGRRRSDLKVGVPGIVAFLALVVLINPSGNFPLNDDWQYAYPVKTWVEQGVPQFKGIFAPNILLQVAWGYVWCWLVGSFDFTWLRFSTLALALVALVFFKKICRETGSDPTISIVGTMTLGTSPLFFSLSFSFMSDVPFLALCLLSLHAFLLFLKNRRSGWLAAACVWAVASYGIRQPGLVLLPCYALFIFWENLSGSTAFRSGLKGSDLKAGVPVTLLFLAALAYLSMEKCLKPALGIVENYVPVGEKFAAALLEQPLVTATEWGKKILKTFVYLGFFTLPLLPFFLHKMKETGLFRLRFLSIALTVNMLLLFFLIKTGKTFPFGGNVLFNCGLGPELLADVYTLGLPNTPRLPGEVWLTLQFVSQLSATFLFVWVVKQGRSLEPLARKFAALLLLVNAAYLPLMSITSFFDRYLLLPIASFFIVLAMAGSTPKDFGRLPVWKRPLKWLPFFLMAWFSIAATKDYLAWNRSRSEAFQWLENQGVSIREMDAGYELNGFFNYHPDRKEIENRSFWWVTDDRWLIAFGDVPGYEKMRAFPFQRWLFFEEDALWVLKREL